MSDEDKSIQARIAELAADYDVDEDGTIEEAAGPTEEDITVTPDAVSYVIIRDDGKYVTPPGQEHSYTDKLQFAYLFRDLEEAERAKCGNERILPLGDAVQGSRRRG